jgi:hypothetical protein
VSVVLVCIGILAGQEALLPTNPPEHPPGHRHDDDSGGEREVRLRLLNFEPVRVAQPNERQRPDDDGVRDGRGEAEERGLPDGSPDGDDECGHHRLAVAWLQAMQRAQQDGGRDEQPGVALSEIFLE